MVGDRAGEFWPVRRALGLLCRCLLAAGLLSGGLLAAGCTWVGGGGPQTPDGYRRVAGGPVSFAHPEDWRALPAGAYPEGWTATFEKRAGGSSVAQAAVFLKLPTTADPFIAAEAAITGAERGAENMRRTGQRELEVTGAAGAVRIDYRYSAVAEGQLTGETMLGTDVTVVDDAGRAATVRITRVQGRLPDRVAEAIVDSIEMQPPE